MTAEPVLSYADLTAGYGRSTVLHGIDLNVLEGEILCLVGPNGSGKSTLLNTVFGIADVKSGAITFNGEDISEYGGPECLEAGIGYVYQSNSIFPDMSVHENLLMGGFILEDDSLVEKRIRSIYNDYPRLAERKSQQAGTLSGGERRLLEFTRVLVVEPEVILIDEPSLGLEPQYLDIVYDAMRRLNDDSVTIMLVEQNVHKGLELADRGAVLANGEIQFTGPTDDLLEDDQIGRLYLGEIFS